MSSWSAKPLAKAGGSTAVSPMMRARVLKRASRRWVVSRQYEDHCRVRRGKQSTRPRPPTPSLVSAGAHRQCPTEAEPQSKNRPKPNLAVAWPQLAKRVDEHAASL